MEWEGAGGGREETMRGVECRSWMCSERDTMYPVSWLMPITHVHLPIVDIINVPGGSRINGPSSHSRIPLRSYVGHVESFNAAAKVELSWSPVARRWGEAAVVCGKKLGGMREQNKMSGPAKKKMVFCPSADPNSL